MTETPPNQPSEPPEEQGAQRRPEDGPWQAPQQPVQDPRADGGQMPVYQQPPTPPGPQNGGQSPYPYPGQPQQPGGPQPQYPAGEQQPYPAPPGQQPGGPAPQYHPSGEQQPPAPPGQQPQPAPPEQASAYLQPRPSAPYAGTQDQAGQYGAYAPPHAPSGEQQAHPHPNRAYTGDQPMVPPAPHPMAPQAPQAEGPPSADRSWAMSAHLVGVVFAFMGWLAALVVHLVGKDRSGFVRHNTTEALNFQLTLLLAYIPSWILFIGLGIYAPDLSPIGSALIGVIWLIAIVFGVLAAVQASRGRLYRYPVAVRMVS